MKENKSNGIIKKLFTIMFMLGSIGIIVVLGLLYGPWAGFRDWLITSAMTTMTHQYLATWFYDDNTIKYVLNNNKIYDFSGNTDLNLIQIDEYPEIPTEFANEYERQILERDSKNNDYKIIYLKEKNFDGYLVAIYNPSRIKTVATKYLGTSGQYLTKMSEENNALLAINAGGFVDANYEGTGGTPLGLTITSGKIVTDNSYDGQGGFVGFTHDHKLMCAKLNNESFDRSNIRDGVTFGPFLIMNGEAAKATGNGGWGQAPRSAIGQRKDGIVLLACINGRTATCLGASMNELIEIMQRYGAYNACNLDGGTSSALVVNNKIVNVPIDISGNQRTRPVSTAFILTKDSSDDSDHTVVEDRLK